jgi:hypothetical protein
MKRSYEAWIVLPLFGLFTGCAAHYTNEAVQDPYGFFSGMWHGLIFFFSLLANVISWSCSLVGISFLDSIEIIGRPNTGIWYYVGFVIGLMSAGGGASK